MAPKDRTSEFHSALASIKSRSSFPASSNSASSSASTAGGRSRGNANNEARQPLLAPGPGGAGVIVASDGSRSVGGTSKMGQVSEFGKMAGGIAKDINNTTLKLQKLAQLAKRRTLFDDRPIEISELTYIIRQDIASLNNQIAALQSYVRAQKAGGNKGKGKEAAKGQQVEEHNSNVVMLLQSRLANMGMGFKDVLELRTQNMKASKDRTEQFMHSTTSSAPLSQNPSNSILFNQPVPSAAGATAGGGPGSGLGMDGDRKGKGRAVADLSGVPSTSVSGRSTPANMGRTDKGQDFLALDIDGDRGESGGGAGGGYQQMQLVEQQDNYIQSRSTAIESIESTIAELGQIFTQLAGMVAEQRETVQRIDADTTDIAANVSGAQRELLKYYASVTSNRWLMLKIFGVMIIFRVVFKALEAQMGVSAAVYML